MRIHVLLICAALALAAGCGRDKEAAPASEPPAGAAFDPAAPAPGTDLVTVNGKTLMRAEAQEEVNTRLGGMAGRSEVSAEQLAAMRERMLHHVVDQFIMRTLLLEEADRRGIKVAPEDEEEAFARIAERLPEGQTPEQVMQDSPLGAERMREEVLTGIRINKLLDQVLPEDGAVDAAELAAFKEDNAEKLAAPESARARHILIKAAEGDTDAQKAGKKKEAEGLRKQLADGADFATLAQEHSECPSAERGGDLGTFRRGRMVKPFEDAVFSQEIGAIGPVVETQFGYHIIEVLERTPAGTLSDEKITDMMQGRARQDALRELLDTLRADAEIVVNQ
jgi:peptidyl-prolyl cis-trans isomerase C